MEVNEFVRVRSKGGVVKDVTYLALSGTTMMYWIENLLEKVARKLHIGYRLTVPGTVPLGSMVVEVYGLVIVRS